LGLAKPGKRGQISMPSETLKLMKKLTPPELVQQSLVLLDKILQEAKDRLPEQNFRLGFIYKHASNILDLGDDVLALELQGRSSASRIVVRSMVESLFKLVAAFKNHSFATEKVVAEIEDEIERIQKWVEAKRANECLEGMDETIKQLMDAAQQLRLEHEVTTRRRWNVFDTAKVAELDWHYIRNYFMFSKYVHSTFSGIISQEHQIGRGYVLETMIFIVLAAAGHIPQVIETVTPQAHIDETARLMSITIDLIQQKAFQD
jgi:hypothetical protein